MKASRFILSIIMLCATTTAGAVTRSSLTDYAKSLKGKKKAELKTAVYKLIGSPKTLDYGSGNQATWWGFYYTDRDEATNECINRYSAKKFYFPSTNKGSVVSGMNIEHSFPKSWWGGGKNNAYKDLYNLYPSDTQANSSKSNYPMGIVEKVSEESEGYDKVGKGTIDGQKNQWCWEPGARYKGDFARAYMYMATAYQNLTWQGTQGKQQLQTGDWPTLKPWAYTLYLPWLKNDPVDELETKRNDAVASIQGNRNLFVDYPYLAEYIWGDSIDIAFDPYTSITTAIDDARYTGHATTIAVATPVISPDGGTFTKSQQVTITCTTPGASIYYTTDDSTPILQGIKYSGPITVDKNTTILAVAKDSEGNSSSIASAYFSFVTMGATDFVETFDKCNGTGGNDGKISGNVGASAFTPDNEGWTASAKYGGDQCARFGSSSTTGIVTTPKFHVNGTSVFSFRAIPWSGEGNSLTLKVNGNATLSETTLTMKEGEWTTYNLTLTGQGEVSITFTPKKRFFLDDVNVISEKEEEPVEGDVDGDGVITPTDVTDLYKIIIGKLDKDDYDEEAADIDKDGELTITDIVTIIKILLNDNKNP